MTSQVAVLNKEGVAVASDSVRTLSDGTTLRTFDATEKLFDLGEGHRVVVLTSGAATLLQIPMSVLLGDFRNSLSEPLPSVSDYAQAFVAWLSARTDLLDASSQDAHFGWQLRDYYGMVRREVLDRIARDGLADEPWDSRSVQASVNHTVDSFVETMKGRSDLPDLNSRRDANYLEARRELIECSFIDQVEDMPRTVAAYWRLTKELPRLILEKAESWARDTVVAFIGFGTEDTFPCHQVLTIHGVVNDQVRAEWWDKVAVSVSNPAVIAPFGQEDAINTFLSATHPAFLNAAHDRIDDLMGKLESGDELDSDCSELEELRRAAHEGLDEDFMRLSGQRFVDPVLDAVESLPRTELARVAEALVGVQALRSALACQQPTVGGPIDVVVISRAHGVEWVRRKVPNLAF